MARLVHLSDDIYKSLTRMKGGKSYSEVIKELLEKKSNKELLLGFFGKGGVDSKKVKELSASWKKWSDEYA